MGLFEIYKNKKVLVTGHTGFKGGWLVLWLKSLGADVCGYSLEPETIPSLFKTLKIDEKVKSIIGDIRDREKLEKTFEDFKPEIVFHLAAQPLVRFSYSEPVLTYETNVIGTLNVFEAARKCGSVKAFVNVTTDKCYENRETMAGYCEDEPIGGHDMYSSSKGCVEILSASYRRSFLGANSEGGFALATARAGNVIGGGDWSLDRLLPDCARFVNLDMEIQIRNPQAIRPWQFVLEPLGGYLLLGEKLLSDGEKYAQGFNFGPEENGVVSVSEVVEKFVKYWGKGCFKVHKNDDLHEAGLLTLNIEKAKSVLGWNPVYDCDKAVEKTVEWYKVFYSQKTSDEMCDFMMHQIKEYEGLLGGKTS